MVCEAWIKSTVKWEHVLFWGNTLVNEFCTCLASLASGGSCWEHSHDSFSPAHPQPVPFGSILLCLTHCLCTCPLRKKGFNMKILFWQGPGGVPREKCRSLKCAGKAGVGLTPTQSREEGLGASPLLSLELSLLFLSCPPAHSGELQIQCKSQTHYPFPAASLLPGCRRGRQYSAGEERKASRLYYLWEYSFSGKTLLGLNVREERYACYSVSTCCPTNCQRTVFCLSTFIISF